MKLSPTQVTLAICLCLLATTACDCNDAGFTGAAPLLEFYHVDMIQSAPSLDDMTAIPETDHIPLDFGLVDVGTVARRYLFLRNTGQGDLQLLSLEVDANTSTDFVLGCLDGGVFVTDCAYSPQNPLSVVPGQDIVIEVTYAPADAGTDGGSFTMQFNVIENQTVVVDLTASAVTPEIQVCVADCVGAESDPACNGASELCNDQVERDQMILDFGDAQMDSNLERTVTIRNNGEMPLIIERIELGGAANTQFEIDLSGSGLPGPLEPGTETEISVLFAPRWGGEHNDNLVVVSTDVNEPEVLVRLTGRGVAPRVCPDPLVLDFGNVQSGVAHVMPFNLESCGLEILNLIDLLVAAGTSPDFTLLNLPGMPMNMNPGELLEVQVEYFPPTEGSDSGGVDIFSNDQSADPGTGLTGTVVLLGNAVAQACDIQATPFAVNFGVVELGSSNSMDVLISNVGSDVCTLSDVQITTNSPENEFSILSAPAVNTSIGVAETVTIQLGYDPAPPTLGQDTGTLSLFVNDKDTNEVRVDLNGFSIPPGGDGPIAVCSVNPPQAVPFQTVIWDGSGSYDTNARPITEYRWEIFAFPPGSGATLWGTGPTRSTEVDFAGDYIASLVVVNDLGQTSDRCYATTTVTPTQDLWIEMFWQHSGDDMDLHLLAPGGFPRTNQDCFYGNCVPIGPFTLEWGNPGFAGDNPRLDRDDIPGDGPENINIADPFDGVYTVFVHDYPGSVRTGGNEVTVKVYIEGIMQQEFNQVITGEDFDWYVCTITWSGSGGVVTPL